MKRRGGHLFPYWSSFRFSLMFWFLLFSVTPVAFLTGYAVIKLEKAIDFELSKRLQGKAHDFESWQLDLRKSLVTIRNRFHQRGDISLAFLKNHQNKLVEYRGELLRENNILSKVAFYLPSGEEVGVDPSAEVQGPLSEEILKQTRTTGSYWGIEGKEWFFISPIFYGRKQKIVGYLRETLVWTPTLMKRIRDHLSLDAIILDPEDQIVSGSHPDFKLYATDTFQSFALPGLKEMRVRGKPYGFLVHHIPWGKINYGFAVADSKEEAKEALMNVRYTFYSVVGIVVLLLVLLIVVISNAVLRPLKILVEATERVYQTDDPFEIPRTADNEFGTLTDSFNEMIHNVVSARKSLKEKIIELEETNRELRETQARLVHSSKMVSLGQLVAGVAHELNNPIGFIYSNMSLLRKYANQLFQWVDGVEQNPGRIVELKGELDIEYIKTDLPKLIASCEDGARRTRDIVVGLRNFSRLESSQLRESQLEEMLDTTLALLSGETKGRVEIHKSYEKIPSILCYTNQVNQVFMNILTNAIQSISSRGDIWVSLKQKGAFVEVSIRDSGSGIPEKHLDKIFDPFFSTKEVGEGTGLGLSISYGIVKKHGGELLVQSEMGKGTEFLIRLPLSPPESIEGD